MIHTKKTLTLLIFSALSLTAFCQNETDEIKILESKLQSGELTVSAVLTDPAYMRLHPQAEFREMIRKNAKAERITITSPTEPGKKITVIGALKDQAGNPVKDALVYVYQTSSKGWYLLNAPHSTEVEGDMNHARLFGYLKTSASGKFELETIQPIGYPQSDLPGHIHISFWIKDKPVAITTGELQFADDPRMTPEYRKKSEKAGNLVSANTGNSLRPVYFYQLTVAK